MDKQSVIHRLRAGAFALLYWVMISSAAPAAARPVLSSACAPVGPTAYSSDFEGAVGPEWSSTSVDVTPSGRRFLGQFGNNAVTLTLPCLPEHVQVRLSFDLYVIRSWDGNNSFNPSTGETIGPDVWELKVAGGPALLHTTFANWQWADYRQAYPGAHPGGDYAPRTGTSENDTLGYQLSGTPLDSVYRLMFTFPHATDSLSLYFSASGLQILADESWGIDNVRIGVVSPYVYLPLVVSDYVAATPAPPTSTPSSTSAPTNPPTLTPSFTLTPARTPTATGTLTRSPAYTSTPSRTPTAAMTATGTRTPTRTSTAPSTHTPTLTGTAIPTGTSTHTQTPTLTPTADCANYTLNPATQTTTSGLPRVNFTIRNNDAQNTWIQAITFTWTAYDVSRPTQTLDRWRYDGNSIANADDTNSPTTWALSGAPGGIHALNMGETDTFNFDYRNSDAVWPGIVPANSFGLTVTLGNGCVLTVAAQPTPTHTSTPSRTPSATPTATSTPTPTATNLTPTRTYTPTRTTSPSPSRTPTLPAPGCPPSDPRYPDC